MTARQSKTSFVRRTTAKPPAIHSPARHAETNPLQGRHAERKWPARPDLTALPQDLEEPARQWSSAIEAEAEERASSALEESQEHASDAPPSWCGRASTLTPEAQLEVSRTMSMGERIGHAEGFEAGLRLGQELGRAVGYAHGVRDAAAAQAAANRRFLDEANRELSGALATSPSFVELCERRGEPARADRARALLADRGIA